MLIQHIVFFVFAIGVIFSASMVVLSRNPVTSALFLVATFVDTAVLWLLLNAEFLALVLIFVYVGAVMTLFLFVVMMLNIDVETLRKGFVKYLPFGIVAVALVVGLVVTAIGPSHFGALVDPQAPADYSNTLALGQILYTDYAYAFELAAMLLLVAIVAAISLSQRGKPQRKTQDIDKQVSVRREDRVRLIKNLGQKKS
jgi:NADH-quinone oxidoreductase subunit J